jgi:hypothetical protein
MPRETTLDDYGIQLLLSNQKIVQMIPCLAQPSMNLKSTDPGGSNCQECNATKAALKATAINTAKDCIIGMPADKLGPLKAILNVDNIKVQKLVGGQFQLFAK